MHGARCYPFQNTHLHACIIFQATDALINRSAACLHRLYYNTREFSVMEQPTHEEHEQDAGPPQPPITVPLSPPEDCVQVTEDGGVLKHILTEGSGEVPMLHARCLGECRNRLKSIL